MICLNFTQAKPEYSPDSWLVAGTIEAMSMSDARMLQKREICVVMVDAVCDTQLWRGGVISQSIVPLSPLCCCCIEADWRSVTRAHIAIMGANQPPPHQCVTAVTTSKWEPGTQFVIPILSEGPGMLLSAKQTCKS